MRAAGGTETTQEMIRDWHDLDETDPGFRRLTEEELSAAIFFYLFILISAIYIIKLSTD
jgi:hypothetical protein